jgi:hypothetical protein
MILPLTPDEALIVDVTRGLDGGTMIEQAHVLVETASGVGDHREQAMMRTLYGRVCSRY